MTEHGIGEHPETLTLLQAAAEAWANGEEWRADLYTTAAEDHENGTYVHEAGEVCKVTGFAKRYLSLRG